MRRWSALRESGFGLDPAALAAWLLPLALILYLSLNNGGYDIIERSEVGIIVWWIVLLGTLVGALPAAGGTPVGWLMFALLAVFVGWTALSLSWTESAERTATELARAATYLGVFALALALQGGGRWRYMLYGVTTGVVLVVGIAVLSRLEPTWFPDQQTARFLPGAQLEGRLAYPLNYSSGLSALSALCLPLLLAASSSARTLPIRALSLAAMPVVGLALWFTGSSLSVPLAALGLVVFLGLAPDRLPKLASLLIAAGGGAILIAAAAGKEGLDRGLRTEAAQREGDDMLLIALAVIAGVAVVHVLLDIALRRRERPGWLRIPPRAAAGALAVAVAAAVLAGLATGAPGELSERWDDFRSLNRTDPTEDPREAQILDVSSSGRYQYWEAAVDANRTEPLVGIGPGTFEFWWAREGSFAIFVRDAHSLYMEVLAELGIVGLVLILAFSVGVLGIGVARLVAAPPQLRLGLAAAVAACCVFVAGAAVDWIWELAVLPATFLVLAAICIAGGRGESPSAAPRPASTWHTSRDRLARAALAMVSLAALAVAAIPLAGTTALKDSQAEAREGDLESALAEARLAADIQPYAATPRLQEAVLLERRGDLDAASAAAREATESESTNWRTWLILSRLEAERDNAEAAVAAYREAAALNPRFLPE
jgi:O-antigen ligase